MIRAHTVEQVRAAEATLMARLPEGALMQRAAHGLAYAVLDLLGGGYGRRVLLLVGSGDNGGDALYAGAVLARRGAYVEAWLLSDRAHEAGLAALRRAGGRVGEVAVGSEGFDVVVDGIVGIGGRPPLRADAAAALEAVAGIPVVAVDTPSGVDVDSGELAGPHVSAAVTVTFGTHKIAHLVDPAALHSGAVHLVDIGLDLPEPALEALQPADVAMLLPRPDPQAHKYTRGVVGVRAGSSAYLGAALLSVAGAGCGLAGMVRYVGEPSVQDVVRQAHPEVVGAGRVQAWVVGSGSDEGAEEALRAALSDDVPLVVDADALEFADLVTGLPAVLTPHAGELATMLGAERAEVEDRPLHHVRDAADLYRTTVLLTGRHTLVADPGRPVRVTTTGTSWLATAGAGDVLGGVIGALLAAGLAPYDAASVGSWLHAAAATYASHGGPIVAGDVARALPAVVRSIDP
jgi:hydroxyethylthiazole kinase-like uncharacterized protein yjeF